MVIGLSIKLQKDFSAMPIDQAHEQNNEIVKSAGGAVDLTENPSAFRKWMVSGPEQAWLLEEFECQYFSDLSDAESGFHHEEGFSTQKSFKEQAVNLVHTFNEFGNPFLENSNELLVLGIQNVMDESVVNTVSMIYEIGKEQYTKYYKDVLNDRTRSIHDPIKKNSLCISFQLPSPQN